MNWYEQMIINIKKIKKAMGIRKNIDRLTPSQLMEFYEELLDLISEWEDEHGIELEY